MKNRLIAVASAALLASVMQPFSQAAIADAGPIQMPGTDHWYQVVKSSLTWDEARAAAHAMTFNGQVGHLVTITMSAEWDVVQSLVNSSGAASVWGGAGDIGSSGGFARRWAWIDGPEAGLIFTVCTGGGAADSGGNSCQRVDGQFANWTKVIAEPDGYNGYGGGLNRLLVDYETRHSGWWDNDPRGPATAFVVEFEPPASAVQMPGTNHWYQFQPSVGSWNEAERNAKAMTWSGMPGHLVTISSAQENDFVSSLTSAEAWIGAFNLGRTETTARNYAWVSGPETFQTFTTCSTPQGSWGCAATPGLFTAWKNDQPDRYLWPEGPEDAVEINGYGISGSWNDAPAWNLYGYIVEFEESRDASPVRMPGSDHWYEHVSQPMTWADAHAYATTRMWRGMPGHLATVTSPDENHFIAALAPSTSQWIDGRDVAPTGSRRFEWQSGMEKASVFTRCSMKLAAATCSDEGFADWGHFGGAEPNNSRGADTELCLEHVGWSAGQWNDQGCWGQMGFIIEYEPSSQFVVEGNRKMVQVANYTTSGVFFAPQTGRYRVEMVGGGGSGANQGIGWAVGGGGGGGGYAAGTVNISAGQMVQVTVGVGGAAPRQPWRDGLAGSASSVSVQNLWSVTAEGGQPGLGVNANTGGAGGRWDIQGSVTDVVAFSGGHGGNALIVPHVPGAYHQGGEGGSAANSTGDGRAGTTTRCKWTASKVDGTLPTGSGGTGYWWGYDSNCGLPDRRDDIFVNALFAGQSFGSGGGGDKEGAFAGNGGNGLVRISRVLDSQLQIWSADQVCAIGSTTRLSLAQAMSTVPVSITGALKATVSADTNGFGYVSFSPLKSGVQKFAATYSVKVGKKTTKYTATTQLYVPSVSGPMLKIKTGKTGKFMMQFMPPGSQVAVQLSDGRTLTGAADSLGKATFTPIFSTLGAVTYSVSVAGVQVGSGGLTIIK